MLNQILAEHTGKSLDEIAQACDRDFFMSAEMAVEFGLVDEITRKPDRDDDDDDEN